MTRATLLAVLVCYGSGFAGWSHGATDVVGIDPQALSARIESGDAPLVLDVRTPEEYARGHVPGAINIPHKAVAGRVAELGAEHDVEIVVYCQSGRRAGLAESVLIEAGFSSVRDLNGHWRDWPGATETP